MNEMQVTAKNSLSVGNSLFVFSLNHHQVSLDDREKLALDETALVELNDAVAKLDSVAEFMCLKTCNRFELYASGLTERCVEEVWEVFRRFYSVPEQKLKEIVDSKHSAQMIQHLFEVCSGVDSQMIGETEILGQVKRSFEDSRSTGKIGGAFNRIFPKAFQAAKWVRTNTLIGQGQVSIGNVAVDLAQRIFGDLKQRKVLVIGAGEVARLTAQSLVSRSVESVTFTSRTEANAKDLADEFTASTLPFSSILKELHQFDILIASTSAPHAIIDKKSLKRAMRKRSYEPLFIIDLAMPRDIEPQAGKIAQVFLYDLDDVSGIANENLKNRTLEIEHCKQVLSARSWATWLDVMRRSMTKSLRDSIENSALPETDSSDLKR